ncbi:MAG: hypothetical protein MUP16_00905 [Sedimentisphaerales bacterium]|nr:hypothetical protein [Sedimentisphaerales bacterium]
MKTEIKNQSAAYDFTPTFVQWLNDYRGLSVDADDIAVTRDTLDNFAAAGSDSIAEVEAFPPDSGLDGMKVIELERKGQQLYILDTGEFRLCFIA